MPTVGAVIPQYLEAAGFTHVFGIPGVHNVELYRGLPQSRLRHVSPRHEQGAGFMADGFARASGRPAACFTITGPGLTNILTAMGQAYADSVPMLVVASVNERAALGKPLGLLHELKSQRTLAAGVSGFSETILDPADVAGAFGHAVAALTNGRPRPAYIEIPTDVLTLPAATDAYRPIEAAQPAADAAVIQNAAAHLASARRPLCILGGGAVTAAGYARDLIERLGMPTILTVNARGILPADHPLLAGANLAAPAVRDLIASSDVVVAIGTELGETEMAPLPLPVTMPGTFIRIDIDPHQLTLPPIATLAIHADAGVAIRTIRSALPGSSATGDGAARAAVVRRQLDASMPAEYRVFRGLFDQLGAAMPGYRLVGDSTKPVYAATEFLHMPAPRRFFSASTGYGTLGYALPAAIGAAIAEPETPVVAVVGDGGLMFTLPELAAAVANNVPVTIVVWNNDGYAEIRDAMIAKGIAPLGVAHAAPDIVSLARAFGCAAERARTLADVARLIGARPQEAPFLILLEEADFR